MEEQDRMRRSGGGPAAGRSEGRRNPGREEARKRRGPTFSVQVRSLPRVFLGSFLPGFLLPLWLVGVGGCTTSDPCDPMCATVADAYGACLVDWGLDWTAAGYQDASDFEDACATWAWEQRQLARDAGRPVAEVDQACETRAAQVEEGDCSTISSLDWNEPVAP